MNKFGSDPNGNNRISLLIDQLLRAWPINSVVLGVISIYLVPGEMELSLFFLLWLLVGLVSLYLSKRGYRVLSEILVLVCTWSISTVFAIDWPVLRTFIIAIYILNIFNALRISNGLGFTFLLISALSQTGLIYLEKYGLVDITPEITNPFLISCFYLFIIVIAYYTLHSYKRELFSTMRAMENIKQQYQALFNNANDAVVIINFKGKIISTNKKAEEMLGYSNLELTGIDVKQLLTGSSLEEDQKRFHELVEGKPIPILERQIIRKDNTLIDTELNLVLVHNSSGKPVCIQCVARDSTEKNKYLQKLMEYEQRYQALFNRTGETIFITSFNLKILSANPQACYLLGYELQELQNKPISEILYTASDIEKVRQTRDTLLRGDTAPRYEINLLHKKGHVLNVEVSSATVYDTQGTPIYIQNFARDVTTQRETEEQLKTSLSRMVLLAATDTLTGLNNRRTIENYANNLLQRAKEKNLPFSLAMIDMDNLKNINDKYGHIIGDQALQHLANLISDNKRITDMLGRWAGDEFLLLLPDTNCQDAFGMASRLHDTISKYNLQVPHYGSITIGTSIGVACAEPANKAGYVLEDLIDQADKAMYAAKDAGRNQVVLYSE